jgi:hypothetical protein
MRKPPRFTSCIGPGGRAVSAGSHGRMKPTGGFRRQRGAGARQVGILQQIVAVRP